MFSISLDVIESLQTPTFSLPQCLEGLPRQQHRAQPFHIVLDVGPADDGHVGDVAPSVDSIQPEPGTLRTYMLTN